MIFGVKMAPGGQKLTSRCHLRALGVPGGDFRPFLMIWGAKMDSPGGGKMSKMESKNVSKF